MLAYLPNGNERPPMQHQVSLQQLQTSRAADEFAIVNGHRISVDMAQSKIHFYWGEQTWGRLAGSIPVDKWANDWLLRSVGRFFRVDYQLNEDKGLASIQRNGYLTLQPVHSVGNASLYERLVADGFWDYAISFRGEISYGATVGEAIASLRNKLMARLNQEQKTTTIRLGPASRFNEQQLIEFCQANGLTLGQSYTQQELRQAVLKQRKLNCECFRDHLFYFNIRINCN